MCISLSHQNKIYLSKMKIRLSRTIDNMNDSIVYAVEEFDKKYIEFGGIILRKFNNFWNSRNFNSRNYRYTRANSGYMSPSSRISPFEIITSDISEKQDYDTHNIVINVEEETSIPITKQYIPSQKPKSNQEQAPSQEMVEKHFIDETESFLDDAWDIINGND